MSQLHTSTRTCHDFEPLARRRSRSSSPGAMPYPIAEPTNPGVPPPFPRSPLSSAALLALLQSLAPLAVRRHQTRLQLNSP
jgi:hypothetical protein